MKRLLNLFFRPILLLAVLLPSFSCHPDPLKTSPHLLRVPFVLSSESGASLLSFDSQRFSWQNNRGETLAPFYSAILPGTGVWVEENATLTLQLPSEGEKGVFFHFTGQGARRHLALQIKIQGREDSRVLEDLVFSPRQKFSRVFSSVLSIRKGDRLIISARGSGGLVVGPGLLYSVIPQDKRRYVFVVASDNCRRDALYRDGERLAPGIIRFSRDAVTFQQAYAQSSWTYPSFMSFFTGMNEYRLGVQRRSSLRPDLPFLIESFRSGFHTVSLHGGAWLQARYGHSRGFDYISGIKGAGAENRGHRGALFDTAREVIENRPVPSLFMFLHTYQIHSPFSPSPRWRKQRNSFMKHSTLSNYSLTEQYRSDVPEEFRGEMKALYEAEIMEFDHHFHRFIAYLKDRGIYRQSTIVFLSDHGEEFYEHGGWFHGHSLYNELIQVPLWIKLPQNRHGKRRINAPVALVDVLPTLLDLHSLPIPHDIDGISLRPSLENSTPGENRVIWSSTGCRFRDPFPSRIAAITGKYKLIRNFPPLEKHRDYFPSEHPPPVLPEFELYDLEQDPAESRNLFPTHSEMFRQIRRQMDKAVRTIRVYRDAAGENRPLSREEKEILRSLGYL